MGEYVADGFWRLLALSRDSRLLPKQRFSTGRW